MTEVSPEKETEIVADNPKPRQRRESIIQQQQTHEIFDSFDDDNDGQLNRNELRKAIAVITGKNEIDMEHVESLLDEFDRDENGMLDFCEFQTLEKYLKRNSGKRRSSRISFCLHELAILMEEGDEGFDDEDITVASGLELNFRRRDSGANRISHSGSLTSLVNKVVGKAQRDNFRLLKGCANKLYPFRDILCVQDGNILNKSEMNKSRQIVFDDVFNEDELTVGGDHDPDFDAIFSPSEMRCLALVSHNEMKKTMREFVLANRNILKKFRLTGTNSTMTMLKEVFKDEPPGTVAFGPACASGPLGGDAELVAHMVTGKIGGIFFFQDPMNAHPHRADIDCLVRQALVHNTMMAETPTSALMLIECLRTALQNGRPELIPSFFFSLQSPTVEAYKAQQKAVVDSQKKDARASMIVMNQPLQKRPSTISAFTMNTDN
eukprot:jgi/Psemu1/68376/estExt_Genemark1.C_4900025